MKQITEFKKQELQLLRIAINEALKPVMQQYGLATLQLGSCGYTEFTCHWKLQTSIKNEISAVADEEQNERYSLMLGFDVNIVGKEIYGVNHDKFTITKIEPNRPKYPIVAKGSNGSLYKFTNKVRFVDETIKSRYAQFS